MPRYRNTIYEWEGDTTQPYDTNFTWKSKRFLYPKRVTFNVARVIADTDDRQDYYDDIQEYLDAVKRNYALISNNTAGGKISDNLIGEEVSVNGDFLEDVSAVDDYSGDFELTVKFYVDDTLKYTKEVYASALPFKLPDEVIRGRAFEVQIEGNVRVRQFDMATTMKELMTMSQEGS